MRIHPTKQTNSPMKCSRYTCSCSSGNPFGVYCKHYM